MMDKTKYIREFIESRKESYSISPEDDNFLWKEYVECPDDKLTPEAQLLKRELMIYFLLKELPRPVKISDNWTQETWNTFVKDQR
jgi:hypothetical protein